MPSIRTIAAHHIYQLAIRNSPINARFYQYVFKSTLNCVELAVIGIGPKMLSGIVHYCVGAVFCEEVYHLSRKAVLGCHKR